MLALPYSRIRALPYFGFSNSFFLRVMSPPSRLTVTSLRRAAMVSRAIILPPTAALRNLIPIPPRTGSHTAADHHSTATGSGATLAAASTLSVASSA